MKSILIGVDYKKYQWEVCVISKYNVPCLKLALLTGVLAGIGAVTADTLLSRMQLEKMLSVIAFY